MKHHSRDGVASIRQRLLNVAQQRGEEFQNLLNRYGAERLLYRLGESEYRDRFALKGAALFTVWSEMPYRSTRDIDLLGYGDPTPDAVVHIFRDICAAEVVTDGLSFRSESISAEVLRSEEVYSGVRIKLAAYLGTARIPLQVDVGFVDVITPPASFTVYPAILEFPQPYLCVYPKETVIAEKFHAMVAIGLLNTRMKDFLDIWKIIQLFPFEGPLLCDALQATFARRQTPLPTETPLALTETFATDAHKQQQWTGFLKKNVLLFQTPTLPELISDLKSFLMPPLHALSSSQAFPMHWNTHGIWQRI